MPDDCFMNSISIDIKVMKCRGRAWVVIDDFCFLLENSGTKVVRHRCENNRPWWFNILNKFILRLG